LRPNRAKNFNLVYVGDLENIDEMYIKNIKELTHLPWMSKQKISFKKILNYNCHFSVREENTNEFKYKPNTKLSCASATDSNIILSRDSSFIELLDEAYPYYAKSDLKSVEDMVKYTWYSPSAIFKIYEYIDFNYHIFLLLWKIYQKRL